MWALVFDTKSIQFNIFQDTAAVVVVRGNFVSLRICGDDLAYELELALLILRFNFTVGCLTVNIAVYCHIFRSCQW